MSPSVDDTARRRVFVAASRLLQYPEPALFDELDAIAGIAASLPVEPGRHLAALVGHLGVTPLIAAQADYVATFDLRRRNCLFLTYRQAGDTRRRGMALWRFQALYRDRGYALGGGELPDFLPALLELAADAAPGDAEPVDLLLAHHAAIVALRESLAEDGSPYAHALQALEAVLPKPGRDVLDEARRIAEQGPPAEEVGVEPPEVYLARDPR
jgi:nitrate reductase molybdenum cofactor assembly chaperone NarJ/NarW